MAKTVFRTIIKRRRYPTNRPAAPSVCRGHSRLDSLLKETALATTRYQIGFLAAAAIVALRLGIGLHFFLEGADKLAEPQSFSAGFLGNAKGPLAPLYRNMVWDADGLFRLDRDRTLAHWDDYRNRIISHYQFDDGQKKQADKTLNTYEARLKSFLARSSDEIAEYYQQIERRNENEKDPARSLASLQAHDARISSERLKLKGQLIPTIDTLWKDLETDLNAIATTEQWKRHGRLEIGKVGRRPMDSVMVDRIIPYFDITIGLLLIFGFLTRPAAIAGGLFLLSVCISQWPGSQGAAPIYYQAVEMLALFALAGLGAGRFLGIDYLFSGLRRNREPVRQGETT